MDKLRCAFQCCAYDLKKLVTKPKIIAILFLSMLYLESVLTPFLSFLTDKHISINPIGLFPLLLSDCRFVLIIGLSMLFAFSDAPFCDSCQHYIILRSGKKAWILGQILYILIGNLLFLAFLFAALLFFLLGRLDFTADWGIAIHTLIETDMKYVYEIPAVLYEKIVIHFSPLGAFLLSISLRLIVGATCTMIMFIVNCASRVKPGMIAASLILLLDITIVQMFPRKLFIISISSLARLSVPDYSGLDPYSPGFAAALAVLLACFTASIIGTYLSGKKCGEIL